MEEYSSCSNNSAAEEEIDFLGPRSASGFEQAFGSDSVPDNSQNTNGKSTVFFGFSLPVTMIHIGSKALFCLVIYISIQT